MVTVQHRYQQQLIHSHGILCRYSQLCDNATCDAHSLCNVLADVKQLPPIRYAKTQYASFESFENFEVLTNVFSAP